jgi:Cu-processing system permease protein
VFAALTLAISYFGLVTEGYAGFEGFERTTASLLSLVLYVVPLVALTMATLSLTGDRGATELLFSQPLDRSEILLGKSLGLCASISTATLFGFGIAGTMIAIQVGTEGLFHFLAFAGISLLLASAFLSIGALLAVVGVTRARAFGFALVTWFFLVLFYDLLIIGASFLLREKAGNLLTMLSLFTNPVDVARVAGLLIAGDATIFGAGGAALVKFLGGSAASKTALLLALILWTAGPMAAATRLLKRRDL